MDKKSLALLLVASSIASSAFATNSFINKLTTKHHATKTGMVKTHKMTKHSNQAYTDFSGTWMINCDGIPPGLSTVIENDADYISMDGVEYRIGHGLQGNSDANDEYTNHDHTSLEWNANGTLTMKSISIFKTNVDNSALETDMGTMTFTMKNGQINLDAEFVYLVDAAQSNPMSFHCVLSKKQ